MAKDDITVDATCDCKNEFKIPLAGENLEAVEFTCPACGKVDRFTAEQITALKAAYDAAVIDINDKLKAVADSSAMFQYRPK